MNVQRKYCIILFVFVLLLFVIRNDAQKGERKGCFLFRYNKDGCRKDQFPCDNGNCISWYQYCDYKNQCGDDSDEKYCRQSNYGCQTKRLFRQCHNSDNCIPKEWYCDGVEDCSSGEDETETTCGKELFAKNRAFRWVYNRLFNDSTGVKWNSFIPKAAVALFLAEPFPRFLNLKEYMARDVSIEFLSRVSQKKLLDVASDEIAAFVNAMLVTCLNSRQFYGMDLIEELRYRVDNQNYTNPYELLTLCNAGDTINEEDKRKLADTFWSNHRQFWTDMQAMVVLALSCAAKQPNNNVQEEMMKEFTDELKKHQYRNGSVENIQTTALVLQAIYAAEPVEDPDNFDERKALEQILSSQLPDGSFGNFMETYYVLPVLNCRSLVNITTVHCKYIEKDEKSALLELKNRIGRKKRVQYSLWYGDRKEMERTTTLRVQEDMSLYGIMERAAEIDKKYRFEYLVKNRKPYVNGISTLLDDPETEQFWFLYIIKDGEHSPVLKSPADIMPKNDDHFVMWYRTATWIV